MLGPGGGGGGGGPGAAGEGVAFHASGHGGGRGGTGGGGQVSGARDMGGGWGAGGADEVRWCPWLPGGVAGICGGPVEDGEEALGLLRTEKNIGIFTVLWFKLKHNLKTEK